MLACETCGDTKYECHDGMFYCSTCSTQSQHMVEEEALEYIELTSSQKLKVLKSTTKSTEHSAHVKQQDGGRPWLTVEGFTVVLREQKRALGELGLDPIVSDLVFKLWVLYQRKTRLAFIEQGQDDDADSSKTISGTKRTLGSKRVRDQLLGTLAQPVVPNFRSRKQYKVIRKSSKKANDAAENAGLVSAFGHEEFYEEDNPLFKATEDIQIEDIIGEMEDLPTKEDKKSRTQHCGHIEQMDMLTSVAMWYLALLFTNGVVVPADLLLLIKHHKLPFRGNYYFPSDMKMTDYDHNVFIKGNIPTLLKIHQKTSNLASFLELHPLPHFDIKLLIARYIIELNLPGELYSYAAQLHNIKPLVLESEKTQLKRWNFPNYAAMAMAYVMVIVKLIFGLEEKIHKKQQEFTERIKEIIQPHIKINLFIYRDWVKNQSANLYKNTSSQQHEHQWQSVARETDISSLVAQHSSTVYKGFGFRRCQEEQHKYEVLSDLFGNMHEKVARTESLTENYINKEIDFTPHSILHLTDWHKFLGTITTGGLSEYTLRSACLDDSDEIPANRRVRQSLLQRSDLGGELANIKGRLEDLHPEGTDVSKVYPVQASENLDHWSSLSNRWLLNIAVSYIGGGIEELQKYINTLELLHLDIGRCRGKKLEELHRRYHVT